MSTIRERLMNVLSNEDGSADEAPLGLCEEAAAHIDAMEAQLTNVAMSVLGFDEKGEAIPFDDAKVTEAVARMARAEAENTRLREAASMERHCRCGDEMCHKDREQKMIRLDGGGSCDPCIHSIVKALNDGGVKTTASCCGHGWRPGSIILSDGRELLVTTFEQARKLDRVWPKDINGNYWHGITAAKNSRKAMGV